jgi:hypothetical protein
MIQNSALFVKLKRSKILKVIGNAIITQNILRMVKN